MHRRRAVVVGILVWLFATAPLTPQSVARQDPDPAQSAISGVVTDGSSHAPLRGVTVSLYGQVSTAAVTDSKGRFVFRRLKAGSYALITERGGYGSGTTWSLRPGASPIVVGKKEWVSDLPIELWRLGSISGTVRDEAGEAVVGVPVRALIQVWLAGHRHWASGPVAWTDDAEVEAGVSAGWVAGDEVYGADPQLRAAIRGHGLGYVLMIASNRQVNTGSGRPRVDQIAATTPRAAWQTYSAGAGSKGPRTYDWAWHRLVPEGDSKGHHSLLIRRNNKTGELAYLLCYSPRRVPLSTLVRVAGQRWRIEGNFQAAKGLTGLDQHQVRR